MTSPILKCRNPQCLHSWLYRGHSKHWAICPFCRKVVHTVRDRINVEENKENNPGPRDQSKTRITSNLVGVETP